jgi:D-serine deaminase-like pyridoxal phosphate-dependent protein
VVLGIPTVLTVISHPASPLLFFLETAAIYLLTLGASITAYRLSPFHPLAKYPGPVLARVSRLWAAQGVIRGYQHLESHELFARYGDVVRTGPNHLIMRNASAIPVIHGVKDRWPRHARQSLSYVLPKSQVLT